MNQGEDDPELLRELGAVRFPVYAVAGRQARVTGWGGSSNALREVTVFHACPSTPDAYVSVSSDGSGRWREQPDELPGEVHLEIDGALEPFRHAASGDAWVALRDHYGVVVEVRGAVVPPDAVALAPLVEPARPHRGTAGTPPRRVAAGRRAATGDPLDRGEIAQLVAEHGLSAYEDRILAAVQAGYRLTTEGADPGGLTRIGGTPDVTAGEAWPVSELGISYTHLAQIDCSALPPLPEAWAPPEPWDHGGRLVRIFADLDGRVPHPNLATALVCAPEDPLARATPPPVPEPWPQEAFDVESDPALHLVRETAVRAVPFLTLPEAWLVLDRDRWDDSKLTKAYRELARQLRAGGAAPDDASWHVQQLLGHADSVQGDDVRSGGPFVHTAPELAQDDAWRVLLSLTQGHGMEWWDAGAVAVVAPIADLAAGRYDRLAAVPQMC